MQSTAVEGEPMFRRTKQRISDTGRRLLALLSSALITLLVVALWNSDRPDVRAFIRDWVFWFMILSWIWVWFYGRVLRRRRR